MRRTFTTLALAGVLGSCAGGVSQPASDPLASWNDGPNKQRIIEFVEAVTDPSNPSFVTEDERIATFDNDGTLWVEHPIYTQLAFALDRVLALAPQHPEWKTQQPYKAILEGDREQMGKFHRARLGGDRDGHPCRHDHSRVRANRHGLARHSQASSLRPTLHGDGLSAYDRAAGLPACQRLQDLHRFRGWHRVHAPVD